MARTPAERSQDARAAALHSWANTVDPNARLALAHLNSPAGFNWHAKRLYGQDVDLDGLTPQQWERVADARLAYLRANAIKATRTHQRKRAQALREKADAMEAAANAALAEAEAEAGE